MSMFDQAAAIVPSHPYLVIGAYYIYSAAVSALPMPSETDGKFYQWLFAFLHALAGSLSRGAMALKSK